MADQAVRNTFPRGTQAEFRFGFVRKGGAPIVPIDPLRFPSFAIENPAGIQVQTGVAQAFGDPGSYRVLWTVPEDAMLSDDQSYWIIKGLLVDTKKKQFEFKSPFRVTEQRKPTQESRDVVLMGIENTPFRATWTGDFVPASISVSCFLSSAPDAPDTSPLPNAIVPSGPMVSNGDIVYYVDLPAPALKAGMYTLLWNVQTSASASTDIDYQQLRVISRSVLQFIPQVKFITGRFQAAFDLPNFISDADYVEGLNHGLDFINQWHPISWYSISDMLRTGPNGTPLQNFWIMASAWWVLHSQHLVENGLSFQLSGASTSLDYDRTSGIDAAMGRLREEMTQNLTPAKVAFKYRSQGIGSLSVRPNQLRSYQSRVWRIESGPGNGVNGPNSQLMQMLNVLGISP